MFCGGTSFRKNMYHSSQHPHFRFVIFMVTSVILIFKNKLNNFAKIFASSQFNFWFYGAIHVLGLVFFCIRTTCSIAFEFPLVRNKDANIVKRIFEKQYWDMSPFVLILAREIVTRYNIFFERGGEFPLVEIHPMVTLQRGVFLLSISSRQPRKNIRESPPSQIIYFSLLIHLFWSVLRCS